MYMIFLIAVLFVIALPRPSFAQMRMWICEYCGNREQAVNMPVPGNSCRKNPFGSNSHKWQAHDSSGGMHKWMCEFCGHGAQASLPPGVDGCLKNPFGTRAHKWVRAD